MLSRKVIPCSR